VSWTTRRRLFQDTIVVLVTLLLMAGFLLFVDLACKSVLGNDWIRVIQINPDSAGTTNKGPSPW
jgi:preprotein translocase SecE subunit